MIKLVCSTVSRQLIVLIAVGLSACQHGSDSSEEFSNDQAVQLSAPAIHAINVASDTVIKLTIRDSNSSDVAGYNIYRDGSLIGYTESLTYEDSNLISDTWYCYSASAYNEVIESSKSGSACEWTNKSNYKVTDVGQPSSNTDVFGEDSDYSINPVSFTDNGDGTVTDNATLLVWQKIDDKIKRNWNDANSYCEKLELASKHWRLPTVHELISIVYWGSADLLPFPKTNEDYRSEDQVLTIQYPLGWIKDHDPFYSFIDYPEVLVRCVSGGRLPEPNEYGLALDDATGLEWHTKPEEEEVRLWEGGDFRLEDWEDAINYCEDLVLNDKDDWRLPNYKELFTYWQNETWPFEYALTSNWWGGLPAYVPTPLFYFELEPRDSSQRILCLRGG